MTKDEALERIKELEQYIEGIENKKGRFIPEVGEKYWFVDRFWDAQCYQHTEHNRFFTWLLSVGNIFRTKAEADKHRRKIEMEGKFREIADGWEPDWNDNSQLKYHIYFCHSKRKFYYTFVSDSELMSIIYFETEDQADQACKIANEGYKDLFI